MSTLIRDAFDAARSGLLALGALLRSRTFLETATPLGVVALCLLGLHLAWATGGDLGSSMLRPFSLFTDRGVSERFEYGLSLTSAGLLLLCFRGTGQVIYACLAAVHAWFFLDNAFRGHEQLGIAIWEFLISIGGPPLGESIAFAIIITACTTIVLWGLSRSRGFHRALGLGLAAAAGSLVVFAGVVDMAHAQLPGLPAALDWGISFVEDGGELLIFTLNAALAFAAYASLRRTAPAKSSAVLPA